MTKERLAIELNKALERITELESLLDMRSNNTNLSKDSYTKDSGHCKEVELAVKESEEKYQAIFEASGDAIFIIDAQTKMILDANTAACKLYGYSWSEMVGLKNTDMSAEPEETLKAVKEQKDTVPLRYHKKKNGTVFPVEITGSYFMQNNHLIHIASIRDISERIKAEILLKKSEDKFRNIFMQSPIGIILCDYTSAIININQACMDMFGVSNPEELKYYKIFDDPNVPVVLKRQILSGDTIKHESAYDFDIIRKLRLYKTSRSGSIYIDYYITPLGVYNDSYSGFLVQVQDVTERKRFEEELKYLSMHDPLTKLYNRAYFENEIIRLGESSNNQLSIIMCDIDGLKLVNDTIGNDSGDLLLIAAANVIKESFDKNDLIARIGGDELAILLSDSTKSHVEIACNRLVDNIEKYNKYKPAIPLSLSIGCATSINKSITPSELFKEADNNMCRVKLHKSQSVRSSIVQTLMKALEARDFITEGHAERLETLIVKLANALDYPSEKITDLRLFAKFHDIGKVGIPDRILFKEGPLTKDELIIMRQHCSIGHQIAISARELVPIADWILKHHEWWNGQGYPLGLKGEEIPHECRILAVADAYDAMTSDRPYRKALPHKKAVSEIIRCSETQFDPVIVQVFVKIFE